ncbi:MAG: disulfide bond formation protein DsbA, partial [Epsilonproteobacteria bacterium]|nr:disulfide bond formation protein DsbA [Campylobacterota bacterium]
MNKQLLIASSLLLFVAFYFGGSYLYQKSNVSVSSDKQSALVRPTAFVLGNPDAKTTIVEFFDPACETCKSFYPFVKN